LPRTSAAAAQRGRKVVRRSDPRSLLVAQGKSPELVSVTRARWHPQLEFVVETIQGWLVREEPTRIVLLLPSGPEIALAAEEVIDGRRELAIELAGAIRARNAVTEITYQRVGERITGE